MSILVEAQHLTQGNWDRAIDLVIASVLASASCVARRSPAQKQAYLCGGGSKPCIRPKKNQSAELEAHLHGLLGRGEPSLPVLLAKKGRDR